MHKRELAIEDCYCNANNYPDNEDYYQSLDNFIWVCADREYKEYRVYYGNLKGVSMLNNIKNFTTLKAALNYAIQIEKKYFKYNTTGRIKNLMRLSAMIGILDKRKKIN